jgi:hypothetical protein
MEQVGLTGNHVSVDSQESHIVWQQPAVLAAGHKHGNPGGC